MLVFVEPRSASALHEVRHFPGVRRAEPFRLIAARVENQNHDRRIAITGLPPDATFRYLIDTELERVPIPEDGLVLTTKLADLLNVESGDEIWIEILEEQRERLRLPVTRVVESFIGLEAFMNLTALNRHLREGPTISGAFLSVDDVAFEDFHRKVKETPAIASVAQRSDVLESFETTAGEHMNVMTLFMTFFASIIACGVVYNNARLILAERQREFASMRVLGYRRSEISWILLGELWTLTAIAIPIGLAAGWLMNKALCQALDSELYRIPAVTSPESFTWSGVSVAVAALISGLLVRRRVDRLDLIEVLKTRE